MKGVHLMTTNTVLLVVAAVLAAAGPAFPQGGGPVVRGRQFPGPGPEPGMRPRFPMPGPPGDITFEFLSSEMSMESRVVKGAPYSAEAVTEVQQVLADGNRISRRNTATLYRDSEGRTRREQTLGAIGPWAAAGQAHQTVFINDPVAGVNYVLEPQTKTARKMVQSRLRQRREMAPDVAKARPARRPEPRTESLGKQTIEGVEAEGTRTTLTIPAGEIGNERPLEIVSERWFSRELGIVVLSRRTDPRMGETVYKLTNLRRTEPLRSLFEAPPEYTVKEGPAMFERRVGPPQE